MGGHASIARFDGGAASLRLPALPVQRALRRSFQALFFAAATASCAFGQAYTISTFVGGFPNNAPGPLLPLGRVSAIAADKAGNLFMALSDYPMVVELSSATGLAQVVAGNGTPGYSGDGGLATDAQLMFPSGLAVDTTGAVYIADQSVWVVRKVANGIITTVAGGGGVFDGNNVPATSVRLISPASIAVDASLDLFIADSDNHVVRKVSGGVITTFAGGGTSAIANGAQATSVNLGFPAAVAVDAAGNVYILAAGLTSTTSGSQTQEPAIWKVSPAGVIATAAVVSGEPSSLAVDASGNMYIGLGNTVEQVSAAGAVTVIAGNGEYGYSGDGVPAISAELAGPLGLAIDGSGNIYIADDQFNQSILSFVDHIRKVSAGIITTVAGGASNGLVRDGDPPTEAQLRSPSGVAVDSDGNVYIADTGNNAIRVVSNGRIATVAGTGTAGYSGDGGPATSAELNGPTGIAVDAAGNLYIADSVNKAVRKVSGGIISTAAASNWSPMTAATGQTTSPCLGLQYPAPAICILQLTTRTTTRISPECRRSWRWLQRYGTQRTARPR
jgi:sugar lactone lactonase YvrE